MLLLPPVVIAAAIYGYIGAIAALSVFLGWRWWFDGRFSLRKFYGLMGWVPVCFALLAVFSGGRYLALFFAAACAGIAGELLVSHAYHRFLGSPVWTYSYGARSSGYTSTLNVLPWAFGGLLFQQLGLVAGLAWPTTAPVGEVIVVSGAALGAGCLALWPLRRFTAAAEGRFSIAAFALFCAPIGVVALALTVLCGPRYGLLMLAFSPLGFITEYAYGRIMSLFFEEPLWRYQHLRIDHGHTSFVTLPLWALGGLYFHLVAGLIGL